MAWVLRLPFSRLAVSVSLSFALFSVPLLDFHPTSLTPKKLLRPFAAVENLTGGPPSIPNAPAVFAVPCALHKLPVCFRSSLDSRESPVDCDNINNYRTLLSIITGCLATVFACTWVSVHPNVPPPGLGLLALSWRRFCLMLVAVVAPELMVGFAARQFLDARWFSKEYGVSRTHGFFFTMGGFVARRGHHPIVTQNQLELYPEYLVDIRSLREEDIADKSKGDAISKSVAVIQGLWFTMQCLARVHQHIPLTQLEVSTLAFQFVSIFIWLLWWNKPLDVQRPILIGPGDEFVKDTAQHATLLQTIGVAGDALILGDFPKFNPISCTSVPSFWSTHGHHKRTTHVVCIIIQSLVGAIFGAIHCATWNAFFPSTHEMWMCRSCSFMIAAIPVVLALAYLPLRVFSGPQNWAVCSICILYYVAVPFYLGARVVLIVLPFTTLRSLQPGAFVDVDWNMYIPHLGL
ncbi:hypothetical protein MVEN_00822200 [Mycena venus]|uniref:Transmembrane protein n=1 Tax=Mycena venus TaxID=2733690 RepID=A0A8H7D381_9AGAR|nr:hypothetical protein MVEN_00822200 [Mycena venus]